METRERGRMKASFCLNSKWHMARHGGDSFLVCAMLMAAAPAAHQRRAGSGKARAPELSQTKSPQVLGGNFKSQ